MPKNTCSRRPTRPYPAAQLELDLMLEAPQTLLENGVLSAVAEDTSHLGWSTRLAPLRSFELEHFALLLKSWPLRGVRA
jgi:hypothetical protein